MSNKMMWVLRILAIIGILGFILPYCMVSCSSEQAIFTAAELAVGTEILDQEIEAQPLVWLLVVIPALTLVIAFVCKTVHSKGLWIVTIIAAIGALWVNSEIKSQIVLACSEYNIMYEMQIGYTLVQIFGIVGIVFAALMFLYVSGIFKKFLNKQEDC